jgi:protein O-GlcNAc transferase
LLGVNSKTDGLCSDAAYIPAHVNLGVALSELEKYEEAAEIYQKAIIISPLKVELHEGLGNALL